MNAATPRTLAVLVTTALVLLPAGAAQAKRQRPAPPPPAPAPAPVSAGLLDVGNLDVVVGDDAVGVIADVRVRQTVRAEQLVVAVRQAGGTWDGALTLTRVGPVVLEPWQPVQLSSERVLPAGRYEALVAVRVDGTWHEDELVTPFTVQ